ncbi:hypothetical protein [Chitinophaga qingshengii]|uniref:ATP synthase F0 sector subunit C n=1 Tax=Chitinophaga qingshengii TaxID=1569794 RepID=A0ABR7TJS5_9BACT|nr:hypothetical protein [Chitinophaga qingshengii]MBC9930694.1 hypothetical protein [Chitinophaga qingshengii]
MESKKSLLFLFTIIAFILGMALFKQFNFQTFSFAKPALAILYSIVFVASVVFVVRGLIKK